MAWSNTSKSPTSFTNTQFASSAETWDQATIAWDDTPPATWQDPTKRWSDAAKSATSFTNTPKS